MGSHGQLLKSKVVKVDSENSWDFYVTKAKNQACPVMVHFTASWCVPSVAMNHIFEQLASNYQDILFLLVDVDEVKVILSWVVVFATEDSFRATISSTIITVDCSESDDEDHLSVSIFHKTYLGIMAHLPDAQILIKRGTHP